MEILDKTHEDLIKVFHDAPAAFDEVPKEVKIAVGQRINEVVSMKVHGAVASRETPPVLGGLLKVSTVFASSEGPEQAQVAILQDHVALLEAYHELQVLDEKEVTVAMLLSSSKGFAKLAGKLEACDKSDETHKIQGLLDAATILKDTTSELAAKAVKKQLASAVSALEKVGLGGDKGASWKASLSEPASWADIQTKAAAIVEPGFASRLKGCFGTANQDIVQPPQS